MNGLRRYSLVLPESLFRRVYELADEEHATIVDVIRRFVVLGLKIHEALNGGGYLIVRTEDENHDEHDTYIMIL